MLKSSHLGLINDIRISDQWQEKPADCWWKCASSCRNAENGSSNDLSFGWHHDPRRRKLVPKGKHLEKKERGHFQNHRQHKVTPFFNWGWPFSWDLDKKSGFFRVSGVICGRYQLIWRAKKSLVSKWRTEQRPVYHVTDFWSDRRTE